MKIEYDNFFSSPIVRRLEEQFSGPSKSCATVAFIKLVSFCETGRYIKNHKSFIRVLEVGEKIGKQVWNFCIENRVLTETEYGYTAVPYLLTNRLCTSRVDKDIDDVPFIMRRVKLSDLGIILTQKEGSDLLCEYENNWDLLSIAKHFLFNWMEAKKKRGYLVDGFDAYRALTTWVKKTITNTNFDRQSYLNKIRSIEEKQEQEGAEDSFQLIEVK